jgi:hypothetical protein
MIIMRYFVIYLINILFLSILLGSYSAVAEDRVALVIGNWEYSHKPLKNPKNDVRDMRATLKRLGFSVIYRENLSQIEMEKAILEFKNRLERKNVGFFYYSGHGAQTKGRNYLLPVDIQLPTSYTLKDKAINAQWIVDAMEGAKSKVNIVILDACRNVLLDTRGENDDKGLAAMNAPLGTIINFSAGVGEKASDGRGRNGLYTQHLLNFMEKPGLTIEEVFKKTRQQVVIESGREQVPWVSTSLIGDFCLVNCGEESLENENWEYSQEYFNAIRELLDLEKFGSVPSDLPIYVTYLTFMDADTKTIIQSTEIAELINKAVVDGIQLAKNTIPNLEINHPGHKLANTSANVHKLINIFWDFNLTNGEKMQKIITEMMEPNRIDVIVTGQYLEKKGDIISVRPFVVSKNKRITAKTHLFDKTLFLCIDPNNFSVKILCTSVFDKIRDSVKILLEEL